MVLDAHKITAVEFDEWVHLPENVDINYELIAGEIVSTLSHGIASSIGILIGGFITVHVVNHDLGHTTGADGGYQVGDERYIPDTGFITKARMPDFESASYISIPPDLAVEVVSPTDSQRLLMVKIGNYLAAGTTVWVVYPEDKEVEIYTPKQSVKKLTTDDTLDGGDLLPGFKLPLQTVFKSL